MFNLTTNFTPKGRGDVIRGPAKRQRNRTRGGAHRLQTERCPNACADIADPSASSRAPRGSRSRL